MSPLDPNPLADVVIFIDFDTGQDAFTLSDSDVGEKEIREEEADQRYSFLINRALTARSSACGTTITVLTSDDRAPHQLMIIKIRDVCIRRMG